MTESSKRQGGKVTVHKVGALPAAMIVAACSLSGCEGIDVPLPAEVVSVGALLPLSGDFSSGGTAARAALELAVDEANDYLAVIESNRRVQLVVHDTGTDPETASDKLRELAEAGVSVVVGPMSSEELSACKPLADRVRVLLVSPSATAASLGVIGDNVMRFAPDDTNHAAAAAAYMRHRGIEAAAVLRRDGLWGEELSDLTMTRFADAGGTSLGSVGYDPTSFARNDFRDELAELGAIVGPAVADFGSDKVAVFLASYGEGVEVLAQAAGDPVLSTVDWFAADGLALNPDLLLDTQAAEFASTTGLTASAFGSTSPERFAEIQSRIEQRLGQTPHMHAIIAYDIMWSIALTINEAADPYDVDFMKTALPQVADFYNGASGRIFLNEAGDRTEGNYGFWAIFEEEAGFTWRWIALYEDSAITTNGIN